MYLFIFESIGTSELFLIGIVALIFLGPRKLPEIARKAGKIMSEFRGTANEFKQTWEKEVNFEEETKSFDLNTIDAEVIARDDPGPSDAVPGVPEAPAIKAVDPASFRDLAASSASKAEEPSEASANEPETIAPENDKRSWL